MEKAPTPESRSRAALLGGLPSTFWWLWTGWLISALANFVFPFLAFFLTARGFSPSRVGLVVSLFGAGSVIAGPVAGVLTDRIGRRPTILFPSSVLPRQRLPSPFSPRRSLSGWRSSSSASLPNP